MPATALAKLIVLPPQIERLSGSLWQGDAALTGGYTLHWDTRLGGLVLGRLGADVTLIGADTLLAGQLRASPRQMSLRDVAGRAGPGLLELAPNLAVTGCTSRAVVDVPLLALGRSAAAADGTVTLDAGACTTFDGTDVAVPSLTLTLTTQGPDAVADLTDAAATPLAQITVAGDHRLILRLDPAGAMLIPGLPTSGPIILEYPF